MPQQDGFLWIHTLSLGRSLGKQDFLSHDTSQCSYQLVERHLTIENMFEPSWLSSSQTMLPGAFVFVQFPCTYRKCYSGPLLCVYTYTCLLSRGRKAMSFRYRSSLDYESDERQETNTIICVRKYVDQLPLLYVRAKTFPDRISRPRLVHVQQQGRPRNIARSE